MISMPNFYNKKGYFVNLCLELNMQQQVFSKIFDNLGESDKQIRALIRMFGSIICSNKTEEIAYFS
jgi:hypothetical protein